MNTFFFFSDNASVWMSLFFLVSFLEPIDKIVEYYQAFVAIFTFQPFNWGAKFWGETEMEVMRISSAEHTSCSVGNSEMNSQQPKLQPFN